MEQNVKKIFINCQASSGSHPKLVKQLIDIYLKSEFEIFVSHFFSLLKHSLIHGDKQNVVERTLHFVAKFATSVKVEKGKDESHSDDGDVDEFLVALFEFLLKNHEANSRAVRFRVCQLINKTLNGMGEQASIDDDLYNTIYDTMLHRLMDKIPAVRVQAILALGRLQDPLNKECPVIKAYLFHLSMDPNPEVRRAVLNNIAITFQTLPDIIERIRDVRDLVRRQAYVILAQKVHIRSFTIAQRVLLISEGLHDRSEMVRNSVKKTLIPAWLRLLDGSVLNLLKCLDVEASTESAQLVLMSLFENVPYPTLVENFDVLNDKKLIDYDKLKPESSLYWKCLVQHLHNEKVEDLMDDVLPDLTAFCHYLRDFVLMETTDEDDPQDTAVRLMEKDFICQQLLFLASFFDFSDEVGKRTLMELVHDLFMNEIVGENCLKELGKLFALLFPPASRIDKLASIISDLREPEPVKIESSTDGVIPSPVIIISETEQRQNKVKLAQIRVKINEVRDGLEECVRSLNLEKAQQLKEELNRLEEEQSGLLCGSSASNVALAAPPPSSQNKIPEDEEPKERDDPHTLSRCLVILCEVLCQPDIETLHPILRSLHDYLILMSLKSEEYSADAAERDLDMLASARLPFHSLILWLLHPSCFLFIRSCLPVTQPSFLEKELMDDDLLFTNADLTVRKYAVKALVLSCLLSKELAQQHLLLIVQISRMDIEEIQLIAVRGLFDLFLLFGIEEFNSSAEGMAKFQPNEEEIQETQSQVAGSVITLLIKMLDTESSTLKTLVVEGLCKLLLTSRISSVKLLTQLILLWYNPETETANHLRQILGVFFPQYAAEAVHHQGTLAASLVPTLQAIFNAPARSPLSFVDVEDVASFLVSITGPSVVLKRPKQGVNAHDNLGVGICTEIVAFPDREYVRVLVKCLGLLSLSSSKYASLRQIDSLCKAMKEKLVERSLVKGVEKFHLKIKSYLESASVPDEEKEDVTLNESLQSLTIDTSTASETAGDRSRRRKHHLYTTVTDSIELTSDVDSETEKMPRKKPNQDSSEIHNDSLIKSEPDDEDNTVLAEKLVWSCEEFTDTENEIEMNTCVEEKEEVVTSSDLFGSHESANHNSDKRDSPSPEKFHIIPASDESYASETSPVVGTERQIGKAAASTPRPCLKKKRNCDVEGRGRIESSSSHYTTRSRSSSQSSGSIQIKKRLKKTPSQILSVHSLGLRSLRKLSDVEVLAASTRRSKSSKSSDIDPASSRSSCAYSPSQSISSTTRSKSSQNSSEQGLPGRSTGRKSVSTDESKFASVKSTHSPNMSSLTSDSEYSTPPSKPLRMSMRSRSKTSTTTSDISTTPVNITRSMTKVLNSSMSDDSDSSQEAPRRSSRASKV